MKTKILFLLMTAVSLSLNIGCANGKKFTTMGNTLGKPQLDRSHNPHSSQLIAEQQVERQKVEEATRLAEERGLPPPPAAPPEASRVWGRQILPSPY